MLLHIVLGLPELQISRRCVALNTLVYFTKFPCFTVLRGMAGALAVHDKIDVTNNLT
jgi:hypothetical protein